MTIRDAHAWASNLGASLNSEQRQIAEEVLKEIRDRLQFMRLNAGPYQAPPSIAQRRHCQVGSPSASVWLVRSAAASSVCSTSSTSPRLVFTLATTVRSTPYLSCGTWGTRCWLLNMMQRPWRLRTGSSTWGRAQASLWEGDRRSRHPGDDPV